MIRCTIELLPGGSEDYKRTIGMVEIANSGGTDSVGNYRVVLKKTPPFKGCLKQAWRSGTAQIDSDTEDVITAGVEGHHRTRRGVYDLLYRALKACGLEDRCPRHDRVAGQ